MLKMEMSADKNSFLMDNIDLKDVPFWRYHLSNEKPLKDGYVDSCIQNRLNFSLIEDILVLGHDSYENRIYYTS